MASAVGNQVKLCSNFAYTNQESRENASFLCHTHAYNTPEKFDAIRVKFPNYHFTDGDSYGMHALHYVSQMRCGPVMIPYVVEHGGKALLNMGDDIGRTPLHVACGDEDNLSSIQTLVSLGADVNIAISKEEIGQPLESTPLWVALHKAKSVAIAVFLLQNGAVVKRDLCGAKDLALLAEAEEAVKKLEAASILESDGKSNET